MANSPKTGERIAAARSRARPIALNLGAYALAAAIIWIVARGLSPHRILTDFRQANLRLFVPVAICSLLFWLIGDSWSYARLFSALHLPTRMCEVLPGAVLHEFLQVVNGVAAGTSLTWYLHWRKGIGWLKSGSTLALLGFLDLQIIALMLLIAGAMDPHALFGFSWRYPALFLAASWVAVALWPRRHPASTPARWLGGHPLEGVSGAKKICHLAKLGIIRALIFLTQGGVLYLEMAAFGIHTPLLIVMTFMPALFAAGALLPFMPMGLGPRQAAIVVAFRAYGSRTSLLAMSLAHSSIILVARLALGLLMTKTLIREYNDYAASRAVGDAVNAAD